MSRYRTFLWNIYTLFFLVLIDVYTKQWAIAHCADGYTVNQFAKCELTFNRGISWSFFDGTSTPLFIAVSFVITCILALFMWYSYNRWKAGYKLGPELFIIAGAFGNLYDRFVYGGVADFIVIHYRDWAFPTFNMADIYIVGGVLFMIISQWREEQKI